MGWLAAVSLAVTIIGVTQGAAPEGYILFLEATANGARLVTVAAIDRSTEPRRRPAPDDWRLELRDRARQVLRSLSVENPWHAARDRGWSGAAPFSVKIPGQDRAALAVLLDHEGRELLVVPLDAVLATRAESEHRRFLDSERRNRDAVGRLRSPAASQASVASRGEALHPSGQLDGHLRTQLDARATGDVERLRRYGLSPRQAAEAGRAPARAAAWQRVASELAREPEDLARATTAITRDHTLTGQVRNAETNAPVSGAPLFFYLYDFDWEYVEYIGSTTTSSGGYYAMRVGEGNVVIYCGSPQGTLFAGQVTDLTVLDSAVADILLLPGVLLTGTATTADGAAVANLLVRGRSPRFLANQRTDSGGRYAMIVPRDLEFRLWAEPDSPLVAPATDELRLAGNGNHDFVLPRGWVLSGRVSAVGGNPLADATVVLRHLASSSSATPGWSATTGSDGSYAIAVPRELRPASFALSVHREGSVRYTAGLELEQDTRLDVALAAGIQVSGTVRDTNGTPLAGAVVRAFADGAYTTSADTEEDGSYRLGLEPGLYSFTAGPYHENAPAPLAPVQQPGVQITAATTLDFALPPAEAVAKVRLRYPSESAHQLGQGIVRLEVRRDDHPVQVTLDSAGAAFYDDTAEAWVRETRVYLEPGSYDLRVYAMGCEPFTVSDVALAAGSQTLVERTLPEPITWHGVLRSPDGTPLPYLQILSYDDLATQTAVLVSNGDGSFRLPLTPGGAVRFFAPDSGRLIRRVERLDAEVVDRSEDCVLEALDQAPDSGGVMTQIWGTGDPSERYNLVILGDGYTGVRESFTDSNGNGEWDGVLFVDLNGNGLWDGPPERYAVYGDALPPQLGADPTAGNETFVDLNGDGFPNLDDQARYDHDSAALLRALFGSDVWSEARDVFNVYRIRLVSAQAGMDILDQDRRTIQSRDTVLGSRIEEPDRGFVLGVDDPLVQQYVNRHVPFADTQIVLINQPVQIGRANSYILMRGGPTAATANSYTLSHEMGHNVGKLADEYEEFSETYEGPELLRPNITTFTDRTHIPWHDLIPDDAELPSAELTPGVGLYEGAYYQPGGVYRPVQKCTMRGSERFCPVCTREIRVRIAALTGEFPGSLELLAPRGSIARLRPLFQWRGPVGASHFLLELEAVGEGTVASVDIWAESHAFDTDLEPATPYRWRVRPGSEHVWGEWSEWAEFQTPPLFDGVASGVAAAPGRLGSDWHSDLWLHNAGSSAAGVHLCFAALGSRVDLDGCTDVTIAAGATTALRDVVSTSFGRTASGAVLWKVTTGDPTRLLVEGRTFDRISEQAHMGHAVFGRLWSEAPPAGTVQWVPIAAGSRFRTNLDLVSDQNCTHVRLVIRDPDGATQVDETLAVDSSSWIQLGDVVARYGLDPTHAHAAEIEGLGCRIVAGGSVVDNLSNDATRILAQTVAALDGPQWLMGAAYLPGVRESRWRTGLTVVSIDDSQQTHGLTFVPRGGTWNQRAHQAITLEAKGIVTADNVLAETFGLPEGSVGSLRFEPGQGSLAAVFMRTFAEDGALTYGQYVPPWPAGAAIAPGTEGRLVGLNHGPGFRTNLLLQNTHADGTGNEPRATSVEVELLDATGTSMAHRVLDLAPGENLQLNGLVTELLGPAAELADFVVLLTVDATGFQPDSTGGVIAAASEVNGNLVEGTNDPRLVTARLLMSPG